jgi:hypothetical protein
LPAGGGSDGSQEPEGLGLAVVGRNDDTYAPGVEPDLGDVIGVKHIPIEERVCNLECFVCPASFVTC